jgi:SAM-dependent methyltransferase
MTDPSGYEDYPFTAEFYDHFAPYKERTDVTFFVQAAQESGGPVLEVGCGTGRVLIPTARAGVEITGLDLAESMLAVCRERLAAEPLEVQARVRLVQTDMRNFDLTKAGATHFGSALHLVHLPAYKLITLPFRPFQHLLTVEDQLACLACLHRHLAVDGRLVLDLFNPSFAFLTSDTLGQELGEEPEFTMPDGRRITRRSKIVARDYFTQVNQVELIYYVTHQDGRTERLVHPFPMRYLFRFEAEHLLARAGFTIEQFYADYDRNPYGSKYPGELIFVARKVT